ncbi:MAG: hypothetical protein IPM70_04920 [Proteobacteria bacterium]|jgi:Family of unknown function (DUF6152)|nr:hypothetical protein [Pseudomonadota bacterium]MBK9251260.1 hypothetical protein [Pseudomonadota bacterium]MCC6632712.1 hypothetical protein [Gammaproteobacteria bacterium]
MKYRNPILLGLVLSVAAVAQAHHSFAMFDNETEQTIEGTVKEFQWTNPHIWVQINVTGADGKVTEYSIEGGSPNGLRRQGWSKDTMKPGDKIVMKMHPMKDGTPGGSFMSAIVNGQPVGRQAAAPAEGAPAKSEY